MFKKRTLQTKTVNINDELNLIAEQPVTRTDKQNKRQLADHMIDDVPIVPQKIASACLDSFSLSVEEENKSQYLQSLRHANLLHSKPVDIGDVNKIIEVEEQEEESEHIVKEQTPKLIVVDDADGEIELLNELQESDDQQYEDEIIKNSLTRSNYERVYRHSRQQPSQESKQKNMLSKITVAGVINRIQKEEAVSEQSLRNLAQDRDRCSHQYGQLREQLRLKTDRLEENRQRLSNIQRILEYVYLHGDTIKSFDRTAILRQAEDKDQLQVEIEHGGEDAYY